MLRYCLYIHLVKWQLKFQFLRQLSRIVGVLFARQILWHLLKSFYGDVFSCCMFFCNLLTSSSRVLTPVVQSCMMAIPSLQVVWRSLTDTFIAPLYYSAGKSLSSVHVKTTQN